VLVTGRDEQRAADLTAEIEKAGGSAACHLTALAGALVLLAAHLGEGLYALSSLDPSMIDESDPLSCDPSLDMYNPDNGYREPPEPSRYTAEFLARYREAQRARCERLDAVARDDIRRRREAREAMSAPGFAGLPLRTRLATIRRAEVSRYLTVARMDANPAFTDMTIHPSPRTVGSLFGGRDPHAYNYRLGGPASVVTPEAWLSTWSGLSSRASVPANGDEGHISRGDRLRPLRPARVWHRRRRHQAGQRRHHVMAGHTRVTVPDRGRRDGY
jgi:hypothetical protein